jgi:hypothetical protein
MKAEAARAAAPARPALVAVAARCRCSCASSSPRWRRSSSAAWVFGSNFGAYQDRATASTLAPLWAEATPRGDAAVAGERTRRKVQIEVESPRRRAARARALELTTDGRMAALARALAERRHRGAAGRASTTPPTRR